MNSDLLLKQLLDSHRFDYLFEAYQLKTVGEAVYAYNKDLGRNCRATIDAYFFVTTDVLKELIVKNPDMFGFSTIFGYSDEVEARAAVDKVFKLCTPSEIVNNFLKNAPIYIGLENNLYELSSQVLTMLPLSDFVLEVDLTEWLKESILVLTFFHKDLE